MGFIVSSKAKVFMHRIFGMSFKRMKKNIDDVHEEFGISRPLIFADMVFCTLKYGTGYLDYRTYGFAAIKGKDRATYMTMGDNIALVHKVNDRECFRNFDDKAMFNLRFSEYIGREWIDLASCTEEDFMKFCSGKENFFAKSTGLFGGKGVERVELSKETDLHSIYELLRNEKMNLCEETIIQHPEMSRLCPVSVNTIRMVTLIDNVGEPHLLYALLRMSSGGNNVDNISSGGMYTPVSDDGTVKKPAFCQNRGIFFEKNPVSGTDIIGFKVPFFKEAVELVKKAALVEPRMRYIGWDVAITEKGPIIVEGNNFPSYDMVQTYHQQDGTVGILPKIEKILGEKI